MALKTSNHYQTANRSYVTLTCRIKLCYFGFYLAIYIFCFGTKDPLYLTIVEGSGEWTGMGKSEELITLSGNIVCFVNEVTGEAANLTS